MIKINIKDLKITKKDIVSFLLAGTITLTGCSFTGDIKILNDKEPTEPTKVTVSVSETEEPIVIETEEPAPTETVSPVYLELVNGPAFETIENDKEAMLSVDTELYDTDGSVIANLVQNLICNKIATNGKYTFVSIPNGMSGFILSDALANNYQRIDGQAFIRQGTNLYYDKEFTNYAYTVSNFDQIFYVDFTTDKYAGVFDNSGREAMYVRPYELDKDYIIVDLDEQQMDCYLDYHLVGSWGTRTGKNSTPTHTGAFDIDWKASNWEFTTYPGSYAKFWIPINEYGEGIHDLIGDDEQNYGNQAYQLDGSHGCIRVPAEASEFVYNNYEVGDMVLVRRK